MSHGVVVSYAKNAKKKREREKRERELRRRFTLRLCFIRFREHLSIT